MLKRLRSMLVTAVPLTLLAAGCGSGSYTSSRGLTAEGVAASTANSGTVSNTFQSGAGNTGTADAILATPSVGGTLAVTVGAAQTLSVTFNSNDGRLITGFGVSNTLGTLPSGWSGPGSFTCAAVTTGSACVLNLVYAPTAAANGTLAIDYVFIDDAAQPKTGGTLTIPYVATAANHLVATTAPSGQVNAVVGASTQPSITFTPDDGNAITHLQVTSDLTALPAGWSSASPATSCAIVSTGGGCQLLLNYAPTTAGSGTLTLNYAFTDDQGGAQTGVVNIPYAATTVDNVIGTASPTGQIIAVKNAGGQAVAVTFTTDDGKPAGKLFLTSDLTQLPAGWSATGSFSCPTVSSGNGCQLHLTYAPTALTRGTLTLTYAYTDASGAQRNGLLNIGYAAATNDVVIGTESPSSQINAIVTDGSQPGNGAQPVTVTFATNDARAATALVLTSNLATLPAGWSSSAASFACAALDADNPCVLALSYAPTAAGSGALPLTYSYVNDAGEPRTGSVSIAYRATVNDNVGWTLAPAALPSLRTGDSASVTVSFATDDGNPASALSLSGLNTLPPGWTAATNGLACATVSTGAACAITLTYAPTAAVTGGMLTLAYAYTNDAAIAAAGTVSIPYSAYTPYLYVVDSTASSVSACALNWDNSLSACTATGSGSGSSSSSSSSSTPSFASPFGIALTGSFAYVTNTAGNSVTRCALGANGALTDCGTAGPTFAAPTYISIDTVTHFAYVYQSTGLTVCSIATSDGSLSTCTAGAPGGPDPLYGVTPSTDGTLAFAVHAATPRMPGTPATVMEMCSATAGPLTACAATAITPLPEVTVGFQNDNLYAVSQGSLLLCPLGATATLSTCQTTALGTQPRGLAFLGTTAYLSNGSALLTCPVNTDGTLGMCNTFIDPTFFGTQGVAVRYR